MKICSLFAFSHRLHLVWVCLSRSGTLQRRHARLSLYWHFTRQRFQRWTLFNWECRKL